MKIIPNPRLSLKTSAIFLALLWLPNLLSAQINITINWTNVTCYGGANGQATATLSGGTPPYTFAWSNSATTQTIQNLVAGTYTVTVTDASQNTKTKFVTIAQPPQLGATVYGQSQLCDIAPDGMVGVVPHGGTPPYTYLWSNGSTTPEVHNLVAGTYTATVTDAKACTSAGSYLLNFWDEGLWLMAQETPVDCAYQNGAAQVTPMTGTAPYQYIWSNGATTQSIDSLAVGTYTVTVTDTNGCSNQADFDIEYAQYWLSVLVQIPTPFCMNSIAEFNRNPPSPIYPQRLWTLSDTLDEIVSGQGTDSIKVQWGSPGSKTVNYKFGANNIYCSSFTYSLDVVVCAATDEPALTGASVSPNPFSDFLQVDFSAGMPAETEAVLTDVSGKIVLERSLSDSGEHLPTANLPAGIYFLKIKSGDGERIWKQVKQ
ncbi:MAG: T9SS type A sorting domain-containing protein [Saprospiraceae bacterium]